MALSAGGARKIRQRDDVDLVVDAAWKLREGADLARDRIMRQLIGERALNRPDVDCARAFDEADELAVGKHGHGARQTAPAQRGIDLVELETKALNLDLP